MGSEVLIVLAGLSFIVILSAGFNYTNLSIARSLRRSKEVGVRKVVGAGRGQIFNQFIVESHHDLLGFIGHCHFIILRDQTFVLGH